MLLLADQEQHHPPRPQAPDAFPPPKRGDPEAFLLPPVRRPGEPHGSFRSSVPTAEKPRRRRHSGTPNRRHRPGGAVRPARIDRHPRHCARHRTRRRSRVPDAHCRDRNRPQRAFGGRRAAGSFRQDRRHSAHHHLFAVAGRAVQRGRTGHRAACQRRAVRHQANAGAHPLCKLRTPAARKRRRLPRLRQPGSDHAPHRRLSRPLQGQSRRPCAVFPAHHGPQPRPALYKAR